MKRSAIDDAAHLALEELKKASTPLPFWALFNRSTWESFVRENDPGPLLQGMCGLDVTDFGSGDFYETGLALVTTINTNTYCHKLMVAHENQRTPMHSHRRKVEHIGVHTGKLAVRIQNGDFVTRTLRDDTPVHVTIAGCRRVLKPGEIVVLTPGESIELRPGQFHEFWGELGPAVLYEVSTPNDDEGDNVFLGETPRFPTIVEDVPIPQYVLVGDLQQRFVQGNGWPEYQTAP